MRELLFFSPCGPLSLGSESMEIFRKPAIPDDSSVISSAIQPSLHDSAGRSTAPPETRVSPDTCAVCGGAASGYNYEAVSCGTCKSFFRRAVLGKRRMICKENGVSKVDLKCRACRFARCLKAGMNPRAIVGEPAAVQNGQSEQQSPHQTELPSTSSSLKLSVPLLTVECSMDRLIEELVHLEMAHERIRRSNYRPIGGITIDECIRGHSRLGMDYGIAPPREKPHGKPRWKFVPMKVRIRDRIPVSAPPRLCEMRRCSHPKPMMWPHLDLVHTIEYVKTFDFFHQLTEAEKKSLSSQVTLLTSYLTNSFYSFELNSDVTIYPDGAIPHSGQILLWSEEDARHDREVHYETIERMRRLRMDRREYALVKALVTCNPAITSLSSSTRSLLQMQRERYASSLMSYVLARRGAAEGPSAYAEILAHVDWLTRLVTSNVFASIFISIAVVLNNKKATQNNLL